LFFYVFINPDYSKIFSNKLEAIFRFSGDTDKLILRERGCSAIQLVCGMSDDNVDSINPGNRHPQKQRLGFDLTLRSQLSKANTIKKLTKNRL